METVKEERILEEGFVEFPIKYVKFFSEVNERVDQKNFPMFKVSKITFKCIFLGSFNNQYCSETGSGFRTSF